MKLKTVLNHSACFVLFALVTSCATPSEVNETDLKNYIHSEAEKILGHRDYAIIWIPSRGTTADSTFVAMSKTGGPSKMAKEIATMLPEAKEKNLVLVFGGVNDIKNIQVVEGAFDLNSGTDLSNLTVIFAGHARYRQAITEKMKSSGVEFHFIELKNES